MGRPIPQDNVIGRVSVKKFIREHGRATVTIDGGTWLLHADGARHDPVITDDYCEALPPPRDPAKRWDLIKRFWTAKCEQVRREARPIYEALEADARHTEATGQPMHGGMHELAQLKKLKATLREYQKQRKHASKMLAKCESDVEEDELATELAAENYAEADEMLEELRKLKF